MLGRTAPPQRADALNAGIAAAGPEDGTGFLWCPRCARRCEHSTGSRAAPSRAVLVRGYGNAIVPQLAAVFVRAALDARGA